MITHWFDLSVHEVVGWRRGDYLTVTDRTCRVIAVADDWLWLRTLKPWERFWRWLRAGVVALRAEVAALRGEGRAA